MGLMGLAIAFLKLMVALLQLLEVAMKYFKSHQKEAGNRLLFINLCCRFAGNINCRSGFTCCQFISHSKGVRP